MLINIEPIRYALALFTARFNFSPLLYNNYKMTPKKSFKKFAINYYYYIGDKNE
jgi:hypothetical protein